MPSSDPAMRLNDLIEITVNTKGGAVQGTVQDANQQGARGGVGSGARRHAHMEFTVVQTSSTTDASGHFHSCGV